MIPYYKKKINMSCKEGKIRIKILTFIVTSLAGIVTHCTTIFICTNNFS